MTDFFLNLIKSDYGRYNWCNTIKNHFMFNMITNLACVS